MERDTTFSVFPPPHILTTTDQGLGAF